MSILQSEKEELSSKAITYFAKRLYYKFVQRMVNKDMPLEDILVELEEIGLIHGKHDIKYLERYIEGTFFCVWDEDAKRWITTDKNSIFDRETLFQTDFELCENDNLTFLKDIKGIVSDMRRIGADMNKVSENMGLATEGIKKAVTTFEEVSIKLGEISIATRGGGDNR